MKIRAIREDLHNLREELRRNHAFMDIKVLQDDTHNFTTKLKGMRIGLKPVMPEHKSRLAKPKLKSEPESDPGLGLKVHLEKEPESVLESTLNLS